MFFVAIAALSFRPKPASFAIVVFVTSFLISSFAAAKTLRYIFYAQPFFFIIVGIGAAAIFVPLRGWLLQTRDRLVDLAPFDGAGAKAALNLVFGIAVVFLCAGNPGFARSAAILVGISPKADWKSVQAEVTPWLEKADIVVTQAELDMLYNYGEYDVLFLSLIHISEPTRPY